MADYEDQTSLITILSSAHGRMRREQRCIEKRDLQKAVKYGECTKAFGGRWRIEYDGIVFITDSSKRSEITAFPSPLSSAEIQENDEEDHAKAKLLHETKANFAASHTVLVIDNSGSMMTHDINLHRDRQTAAYSTTALEFVAEQLFNDTANNSDVISLVEFQSEARVIFRREPISWVLYNKLLSRRNRETYVHRQAHQSMDNSLSPGSNYLPALKVANDVLKTDNHDNCALSLFFLSDGAPSDAHHLGLTSEAVQNRLCQQMTDIANGFGNQLNVTMVGFGNGRNDFTVLEKMADAVNSTTTGAKANFAYCDKMANAIGGAITSLVTSLTQTRTALLSSSKQAFKRRDISHEGITGQNQFKYYHIANHFVFNPNNRDFQQYPGVPPGALTADNLAQVKQRKQRPPMFLALNSNACGEGVERLAFRCNLSDSEKGDKFGFNNFLFGNMVAKETKFVERVQENIEFHKIFLKTQHIAAYLASIFNDRLRAMPSFDPFKTPSLTFLPCSILVLHDTSWGGGLRGVLVEKMLDTDRLNWVKWNNNAGAVDGKLAHKPIDVDREINNLSRDPPSIIKRNIMVDNALGGIAEGNSSDEDDSEDEDDIEDDTYELDAILSNQISMATISHADEELDQIKPSDYLQAFTHFTYRYTNRKVMVCDLQGVYDAESCPPKFELTDPAVHYRSKYNHVYGCTDKGKKGQELFFKTHRCTRVCKLMQLSKINKHWRNDWKQTSK